MLAKRTSKNQITLPNAIVQIIGEADDYDSIAWLGDVWLNRPGFGGG